MSIYLRCSCSLKACVLTNDIILIAMTLLPHKIWHWISNDIEGRERSVEGGREGEKKREKEREEKKIFTEYSVLVVDCVSGRDLTTQKSYFFWPCTSESIFIIPVWSYRSPIKLRGSLKSHHIFPPLILKAEVGKANDKYSDFLVVDSLITTVVKHISSENYYNWPSLWSRDFWCSNWSIYLMLHLYTLYF